MARSGETRAQATRRMRQESLREWLSEKCTAQHFVDNLKKIEGLDPADSTFTNDLAKYKVANEQRLKVMNKYLPDLRHMELSGDPENPLIIETVNYADKDPE